MVALPGVEAFDADGYNLEPPYHNADVDAIVADGGEVRLFGFKVEKHRLSYRVKFRDSGGWCVVCVPKFRDLPEKVKAALQDRVVSERHSLAALRSKKKIVAVEDDDVSSEQ